MNLPKTPGIYAIRHTASGRLYIGSTGNLYVRWQAHRKQLIQNKHANAKLGRAWAKYGEAAFQFMTVQAIETPEELLFWEQFWIDKLDPHFNICRVAYSRFGVGHSDESKEKMAAAKRGKARPDMKEKMTGWVHGESARAKMSAARLGRPRGADVRAKISATSKGRTRNPETIQAASAAKLQRNRERGLIYSVQCPDGTVVNTENLKAFCREHGLDSAQLHRTRRRPDCGCKGYVYLGRKCLGRDESPAELALLSSEVSPMI